MFSIIVAVLFVIKIYSNSVHSLPNNYVSSAMYPKCPMEDWWGKPCRLKPWESDPNVVQGLGGATASLTLLGPVLVWSKLTWGISSSPMDAAPAALPRRKSGMKINNTCVSLLTGVEKCSANECSFVWASFSFIHCLAALDFGAGVQQPFGCLIVQNHQAMQSVWRSMDWTLEDDMVDGLFFCMTLTGRRGGHTPFVQAGAETSDTGAEAVKPDPSSSWVGHSGGVCVCTGI